MTGSASGAEELLPIAASPSLPFQLLEVSNDGRLSSPKTVADLYDKRGMAGLVEPVDLPWTLVDALADLFGATVKLGRVGHMAEIDRAL